MQPVPKQTQVTEKQQQQYLLLITEMSEITNTTE